MNKMEKGNNINSRDVRIRRRRRRRKKHAQKRLILVIFFLMILVGVGGLLVYKHHLSEQNKKLAELAKKVNITAEIKNDSTVKFLLPKYRKIYIENSDLFGWIKIDNTKIDYPVMYTPKQPEKYLRSNFEEKYSLGGLPFMEAKCTGESDNLVIYGHNMEDGSMFRTLFEYENKEFWKEHPIIKFDTIYEEQKFEILSVFYDRVYYAHEDGFKFYQFIDAKDKADYENAINNFKKKQLYDTGVDAEYGDQLITLVTCSYHEDNGRFVVVARKISE